jgi:hypothetical protein
MKKIVLLVVASLIASVLTSCYKHTVCATYTDATEKTQIEKSIHNL